MEVEQLATVRVGVESRGDSELWDDEVDRVEGVDGVDVAQPVTVPQAAWNGWGGCNWRRR